MDVLRMILCELLDAVPQCWNGFNVFVQAEDEAVLLLVVLHESEWVIVDVAEELDTWLHTPVVLKLVHHWMAEEEAGFVSTHVPVADGIAIDDLPLSHIFTDSLSLLLVDPGRKRPVLLRNETIMCLARHERRGHFLETIIERFVIQKDPVVVVVPIEPIFNLANGSCNLPQVRVPGERYKCGIDSVARRRRR